MPHTWSRQATRRARRLWARVQGPFKLAHLTVKRVLALLTSIMGLAAIYHFYTPLFSGPPAKQAMTGELNLAVAGLAAAPGTSRDDANAVSDSLFRTLRAQIVAVSPRDTPLDIQVAGPAQVGTIENGNDPARVSTARLIDSQLKADVLMYGIVKTLPDGIEATPEFYFATRYVAHPEDRQPMLTAVSLPPNPSGYQALGTIRETGSLAAGLGARARLRERLVQRARAFAYFIVGLYYYTEALNLQARGTPPDAKLRESEHYFRLAEPGWDPRVSQVLDLFLGNAALEQHHWAQAETFYARALKSSPTYLRAQYGLAEAQFHRWSGQCSPDGVNVEKLAAARDQYAGVLRRIGTSPSVLRSKAQFGLGRAALCLGAAGRTEQFALAKTAFGGVIADYTRGASGISTQAAGAYGGLGLLVLLRGDTAQQQLRDAERNLQSAIALTPASPVQGALYSFLGNVRAQLGERVAAKQAYQKAMQLDPEDKAAYEKEEADVLSR